MADVLTRREYLLTAIQADGRPLTVHDAEQLMAHSPWPTARRNTLRKDLRGLARNGQLVAQDCGGRRIYHPTTTGEDGRT